VLCLEGSKTEHGLFDSSGPLKHVGTCHPLRQHRQEEMGRQLGLHGPLSLRQSLRGPFALKFVGG
jgi:hypothetical protein